MDRKVDPWTIRRGEILREMYPDCSTEKILEELNMPENLDVMSVYITAKDIPVQAKKLHLARSDAYIKSRKAMLRIISDGDEIMEGNWPKWMEKYKPFTDDERATKPERRVRMPSQTEVSIRSSGSMLADW